MKKIKYTILLLIMSMLTLLKAQCTDLPEHQHQNSRNTLYKHLLLNVWHYMDIEAKLKTPQINKKCLDVVAMAQGETLDHIYQNFDNKDGCLNERKKTFVDDILTRWTTNRANYLIVKNELDAIFSYGYEVVIDHSHIPPYCVWYIPYCIHKQPFKILDSLFKISKIKPLSRITHNSIYYINTTVRFEDFLTAIRTNVGADISEHLRRYSRPLDDGLVMYPDYILINEELLKKYKGYIQPIINKCDGTTLSGVFALLNIINHKAYHNMEDRNILIRNSCIMECQAHCDYITTLSLSKLIKENFSTNVLVNNCPLLTEIEANNFLTEIGIINCDNLQDIDVNKFPNLESLMISHSYKQDLVTGNSTSIKKIKINDCNRLSRIYVSDFLNLEELTVSLCNLISSVPESTSLKKISISGCGNLQDIDVSKLPNLEKLTVSSYQHLFPVGESSSLKEINIKIFGELHEINTNNFPALEKLIINDTTM